MIRRRCALPLLLLCLSLPLSGQAFGVEQTATVEYRNGTQAFKAGDFSLALEHFLAAGKQGYSSHALTYNLGVTHYRLNQYDLAEARFSQLAGDREWRDLAHYNLGLIALRRDDPRRAAKWFQRVVREADDSRLRLLAEERLDELGVRAPAQVSNGMESDTAVLISIAGGYDDNVIAFPEQLQQSASESADYYTELLAYGQARASGEPGDGLLLHGFAFTRRYMDYDIFNANAFGAGISREKTVADWRLEYGASLVHTQVDSVALSTELQLNVAAQKTIDENRYTIYYQPGLHRAGSLYPELEGSVHRIGARWRHSQPVWRFNAGYRLELNDRDDLRDGDMFFSYSPLRHRVDVSANWFASEAWTWTVGIVAEQTRYGDENRVVDVDGQTYQRKRESDGLQFLVRGEYAINERWRSRAEAWRNKVNDTFDTYTYERTVLHFGLEYTF